MSSDNTSNDPILEFLLFLLNSRHLNFIPDQKWWEICNSLVLSFSSQGELSHRALQLLFIYKFFGLSHNMTKEDFIFPHSVNREYTDIDWNGSKQVLGKEWAPKTWGGGVWNDGGADVKKRLTTRRRRLGNEGGLKRGASIGEFYIQSKPRLRAQLL